MGFQDKRSSFLPSSCKGFRGAGDRMNGMTRRDFGRRALTGVSSWAVCSAVNGSGLALHAQAAPADRSGNRSLIGGVQFGLQPFCYHDLAMTPDNRGTLIKRLVQNGFGMVELHATWVEPRFDGIENGGGGARAAARLATQPSLRILSQRQEGIRDAGITIYSYYVNINESHTDAEIDAMFDGAKVLGASGCVGSQGLRGLEDGSPDFRASTACSSASTITPICRILDAFNTEESFVTGLAFSPDVKATLDTSTFHRRQWRLPRDSCSGITSASPACISATGARTTAAARRLARATRRSSRCSG